MKRSILYLLITLLAGCVSSASNIKIDEDKSLSTDEGYLLIGVESSSNLRSIRIEGPQKINFTSKDIRRGTNYILTDLKAGSYTIDHVRMTILGNLRVKKHLTDKENWGFDVVAGEINYVGHFEVVDKGYLGVNTTVELVNRSSESLEFLETNFPVLISARPIKYGGPGEDEFFDFIGVSSK